MKGSGNIRLTPIANINIPETMYNPIFFISHRKQIPINPRIDMDNRKRATVSPENSKIEWVIKSSNPAINPNMTIIHMPNGLFDDNLFFAVFVLAMDKTCKEEFLSKDLLGI